MAKDLFSVPIFFIVFREMIEAAIIVSVLLSFVEQLMTSGRITSTARDNSLSPSGSGTNSVDDSPGETDDLKTRQVLIKRMRTQIWAGALIGFAIALCIGAAFIAVFYTSVRDLWAGTEQLWEGVFSIIAAILIFVMGLAFLKMDQSRVKWRIKLAQAFEQSHESAIAARGSSGKFRFGWLRGNKNADKEARSGKWALFLLPFITVLREGLEAIIFVGGVSLSAPASSIPIPVVVGLICGGIVGYIIYRTGSSTTIHWFLIVSTFILFLIGAGLASKGVGFFQYYVFAKGVGGDVAETGDGPGSFRTKGNVWHLTYGNPEPSSPSTNGGWQIFNAIFGWTNNATLGTVLTYVFYWIAIMAALIYLKWAEGRVSFCGLKSAARKRLDSYQNDAYQGGSIVEEKKSRTDDMDTPSTENRVPVLDENNELR